MKKRSCFMLFLFISFWTSGSAALIPEAHGVQPQSHELRILPPGKSFGSIKSKAVVPQRAGFFGKVKAGLFRMLISKKKSVALDEPTERQKKQGKLSMILGIASIPLLFIPTIGIIAIPAAIAALVLGIKSTKGNSNTQGIVGIVTGSVTLFFVLLALIFVAAWGGLY